MPVLPPEVVSSFNVRTTLLPIQPVLHAPEHANLDFHLEPPRIKVRVPVANPADLRYVEPGMVVTILVSFFYLVWISLRTARKMKMRRDEERMKME
jgi:hypothetical protein